MKPKPQKTLAADTSPEAYITQFCRARPSWAVKGELWKWWVRSLKSPEMVHAHVQSPEFVAFYEDLNELLTAVYQMYSSSPK